MADKDLGALVKPKLNMTKKTNAWAALERVLPAGQVSCLPLWAALVRPHLEFGPVLVLPVHGRHGILKGVSQRK